MARVVQLACASWICAAALAGADLVVKDGGAALLSNCGDPGSVVQEVPAGSTVSLRFSIAGAATTCHSVSVEVDGRKLAGYIAKDSLAGLEELEQQRRASSQVGSAPASFRTTAPPPVSLPTPAVTSGYGEALQAAADALGRNEFQQALDLLRESDVPASDRNAAVIAAQASLRLTRPQDALNALENALAANPGDALLLGLAGVASLQRDRRPEALRYLRQSLEIEKDPYFESVKNDIERELETDAASDTAYGMRLSLRYEGEALPDAAARELTREFEAQINKVMFQLDCRFNDRINVIVRTQENYRQATGAAEWSGGQYDGRIHIAVPPSGRADEYVRETFAHEFVHACLARRGSWPSWFHEGMAQRLSGRTLSAENRDALAQLNRAGQLPKLAQLTGGWARMSTQQAAVAYAMALAAAQVLYQDQRDYGVRNLLNNPTRLPEIAGRIDDRLAESLR